LNRAIRVAPSNGGVLMRGNKKHPLEIFRSAGRPLGKGDAADRASVDDRSSEPVRRPVDAVGGGELKLVLSLNAALVLLFVWVVLMGSAYLFGVKRGAASERGSLDQAALAKGHEIVDGSGEVTGDVEGSKGSARTGAAMPFGVLLVTYEQAAWKEQFTELRRTLREKYEVTGLYSWDRGDKIEVMAGEFRSKDDPALIGLSAKIRTISDWPHGRNGRPFATAFIKQHPDDPARARRGQDRSE